MVCKQLGLDDSPRMPWFVLRMVLASLLALCFIHSASWAQESTDDEDISQQLSTPLGFYEALGFGESYFRVASIFCGLARSQRNPFLFQVELLSVNRTYQSN